MPSTVTVTAPATDDWEQVVARVKTGVVSVGAVGCDGAFIGSGALIGPRMVLTAAHVVDLAGTVDVTGSGFTSSARVIGIDATEDLALLELDEQPEGHRFDVATADPPEASELAVMGFPLGSGLSYTFGRVSALGQPVDYGDVVLEGAIRTDAAINPANSGGPAVSISGQLIGVVTGKRQWVDAADPVLRPAEGIGYLVSPERATEAIERWSAQPDPPAEPECGDGGQYEGEAGFDALDLTGHQDGPAIATTFSLHGAAINAADYRVAFDFLSPQMQQRVGGLDNWSAGLSTSTWKQATLLEVVEAGEDRQVTVELQTEQSAQNGPQGQTCSVWWLRYTLQQVGAGLWQIDRAELPEGDPVACDDATGD